MQRLGIHCVEVENDYAKDGEGALFDASTVQIAVEQIVRSEIEARSR